MDSATRKAADVFGQEGMQNASHVRSLIRQGVWRSHTSGLADQHVQGNVVILPQSLAGDFLRYCQRNPKPCPLLAVSEPGQRLLPTLGSDINICTDVPRYRVWRHGDLVDEPTDISNLWRDNLVGFVIGCSFSFEQALMAAGLARAEDVVTGMIAHMQRLFGRHARARQGLACRVGQVGIATSQHQRRVQQRQNPAARARRSACRRSCRSRRDRGTPAAARSPCPRSPPARRGGGRCCRRRAPRRRCRGR